MYLALREVAPVRDRRRQEYVIRDREIRALQIDLQNGRITTREFLMAAAFHLETVEIEFRERNAEELNRPWTKYVRHSRLCCMFHMPSLMPRMSASEKIK